MLIHSHRHTFIVLFRVAITLWSMKIITLFAGKQLTKINELRRWCTRITSIMMFKWWPFDNYNGRHIASAIFFFCTDRVFNNPNVHRTPRGSSIFSISNTQNEKRIRIVYDLLIGWRLMALQPILKFIATSHRYEIVALSLICMECRTMFLVLSNEIRPSLLKANDFHIFSYQIVC